MYVKRNPKDLTSIGLFEFQNRERQLRNEVRQQESEEQNARRRVDDTNVSLMVL